MGYKICTGTRGWIKTSVQELGVVLPCLNFASVIFPRRLATMRKWDGGMRVAFKSAAPCLPGEQQRVEFRTDFFIQQLTDLEHLPAALRIPPGPSNVG